MYDDAASFMRKDLVILALVRRENFMVVVVR